MGNQQKKSHTADAQIIKQPEIEMKRISQKQETFVKQIQHENQKNVNHRKSSINTVQKTSQVVPQSNELVQPLPPPKLTKKQSSKKQLPPLKLRNSIKDSPLANCNDFINLNQTNNLVQDLQQVKCQRSGKSSNTITNTNTARQINMEEKQAESQKQNSQSMKNVRAKKFRPSQNSINKKQLASLAPSLHDVVVDHSQIPEVSV